MLQINLYAQTVLVNQQFSATTPAGWSSTSSLWSFNYNYGTNSRSGSYTARLPSSATPSTSYVYIPITFKSGYTYTISFYSKRICSATINTNETANQTTLLSTQSFTNTGCNSNWSTWYNWTATYDATANTSGYWQIVANTIYGGPAAIYIEDVTVNEAVTPTLPIKLLYFTGTVDNGSVRLEWMTASETNNDYFTIYRANDAFSWIAISNIPGAGTSSSCIKYSYLDTYMDSVIYYKLRQTDYDAAWEETDPIVVKNNNKAAPELIRILNLIGQEVDITYTGIKILCYSDGTVIKIK
jgi:hypothetical protein